MNKKLLLTTALVGFVFAGNAYAERPTYYAPDLTQSTEDTYPGGGMSNINSILNSGTILEGGKTTISNASLTFTDVLGKPNAHDDGKEITEDTTNLDGSKIDLTKTGTFTMSGGDLTLQNVDVVADKTVSMSGGKLNMSDTTIKSETLNISGGTIALKDSRLLSAGDVNISDGIINLNGHNTEGYWATNMHSDINAAGEINLTGGTINLNADVAGIVNINDDSGTQPTTADININGATINVNGQNQTIGGLGSLGNINLEAGSLNIGNGADLVLMSNGPVDVEGDDETVRSTWQRSDWLDYFTSADKATLNMTGGKLSNAGTLHGDLAMSGGDYNLGSTKSTINGDAAFTGGNVNFAVTGKDTYGQLFADKITATSDANLNLTLNTGILKKDESALFQVLNANDITDGFTLSENTRYKFERTENDGEYKITGVATASDVVVDAGGNTNNAGTATAWDNAMPAQASATAKSVQGALNTLSQTNPKAYVAALTALAPEANGATASTSVEGANQVFGAVGTRLSGGSVSGASQGMASGDSMTDGGAMWVQGLVNKAKLDKADGFDSDSSGLAFGAEKQITDSTKFGVGYAYSNTDIDSIGRKTDVDTHTAIAYGEYKPSNWYVNGIATYSWGSYDENKNVAGLGVKSKYDVDSIGLQAMTGYDFNTNIATITPEVGMRYVNIKQDGYKDSADQKVGSKTDDVWTAVGRVKIAKDFALENGMTITPEARFALTYDMTQADSASVVTLANGANYTANASPLKRFGQEVGLGLTTEVNDSVELNVGYEGKFRSDYTDHTGMFNAKYKF